MYLSTGCQLTQFWLVVFSCRFCACTVEAAEVHCVGSGFIEYEVPLDVGGWSLETASQGDGICVDVNKRKID